MSIYYDILSGLKTRVANVTNLPCSVRKRPVFLTGDNLPSIVVCPAETGELIEYEAFCKQVTYIYPCIVVLFEPANREQEIDAASSLELRELIRNELYQPSLPGATTVYDVLMEPGGAFTQNEQRSNYELTAFRVSFKSLEYRVN